MTQNSNDPNSPEYHLELFLDRIQQEHPGANNEDARAALRQMYDEVKKGEHHATAVEIFTHIRTLLLNDLETWKTQEFNADFISRFQGDELRNGIMALLAHTYVTITKNVAYAGGLQMLDNRPQLLPDPDKIPVIESYEQLSLAEQIMLKQAKRGQA
jgi:hypothetical protein